ncbi:hypothetical protein K435DRAFT_616801, partial [Dendrothele bispora CBS 962.96]
CFMCDDPTHVIKDCKFYNDFMDKGWIKRGDQGKIYFKDGIFVPQAGAGETRKDKILEYAKNKGWA